MKCEKCGGVFPNRKGRFCGTCNWNHPQFVYGESNTMEDFNRRSADVAEMRKELLALAGKYSRPTMAEFLGPNHEEQIEVLTERMGRDVQFWKDETRRAIEAGDAAYVKAMKRYEAMVIENEELRAAVAQAEQTAINFHEVWGRYRDALHIIAHMGISGLSWQHDYEKCVNIAKEALEL